MFQLTKTEYYKILRFQSETLKLEQGKYFKYLPYVFTEQSVAMLASVLRNDVAEEVSIRIMHCGSSFKDLGKKCFEISKIEEIDILDNLLKRL